MSVCKWAVIGDNLNNVWASCCAAQSGEVYVKQREQWHLLWISVLLCLTMSCLDSAFSSVIKCVLFYVLNRWHAVVIDEPFRTWKKTYFCGWIREQTFCNSGNCHLPASPQDVPLRLPPETQCASLPQFLTAWTVTHCTSVRCHTERLFAFSYQKQNINFFCSGSKKEIYNLKCISKGKNKLKFFVWQHIILYIIFLCGSDHNFTCDWLWAQITGQRKAERNRDK